MTKNCLNCEKELTDQYCAGCGQKADTHRITFKNFIFHDVLHGTFHIERGILFTAKEALTRPGKAALDYVAGKRKRYYNVFYLILLTIGIMFFIRHYYGLIINYGEEVVPDTTGLNEGSKKASEIISKWSKLIMLLFVPLSALNSLLLFRRKKLNFSEHAILAGMILLGILLISTIGHFVFYLNLITQFSGSVISILIIVAVFLYIGYGYFNAFSSDYSKLGIAYRIVLFFALIGLEMLLMLYLLVGYVTNWKYGQITITPFG